MSCQGSQGPAPWECQSLSWLRLKGGDKAFLGSMCECGQYVRKMSTIASSLWIFSAWRLLPHRDRPNIISWTCLPVQLYIITLPPYLYAITSSPCSGCNKSNTSPPCSALYHKRADFWGAVASPSEWTHLTWPRLFCIYVHVSVTSSFLCCH